MANNTVNRSVNIFIETGDAEKALSRLTSKEKELKDQLAQATDPTTIKNLQKEIDNLQEPISRAGKKLSGELSPSLRDMAGSIARLSAEIKGLSQEDPNYAQRLQQLQTLTLEYNRQRTAVQGVAVAHTEESGSFGNFAKQMAVGLGLFNVTEFALDKIVEVGKEIVNEVLEAEQANTKLKNILDNIGRADLFETFKKQAEDLHETFKAFKPEDFTNVFTQLATYGKLSENQIRQLLPVIVDFARKGSISLQESTSVIEKALEGNGKSLKEYGINIKDGANVTERFGIIMDQLGSRVKGAEATFEKTDSGGFAVFKTQMAEVGKDIGQFVEKLISAKPTMDQLFDQAKEKTDGYERALHPLLERYDDLKSKSGLNKTEQQELQGVIQRIAAIIPDSVTAFNNYGAAIDINRSKVTGFLEANKKFLAERDADAVKDLFDKVVGDVKIIADLSDELSKGGHTGTFGDFFKFSSDMDRDNSLHNLRVTQESLLEDADKLTDKYGKKLPDSVKQAVDAIKSEFTAIEKTAPVLSNTPLNPNADDPNKTTKKAPEDTTVELFKKLSDNASKIDELNKTAFEKEIIQARQHYDDMQTLLDQALKKGNTDRLSYNDLTKQNLLNLYTELHQLRVAEIKRVADLDEKAEKELNDKRMKAALEGFKNTAAGLAKLADSQLGDARAEKELAVLESTGKKKLQAEKDLLNLEETQALNAADVTAQKRLLIEKLYQDKRDKLDNDYISNTVAKYAAFANKIASALQTVFSLQNKEAQLEIDADKTANDAKKDQFKAQLDGKVITQQQYQRKVAALDEAERIKTYQLKVKEFNQDKALAIARATINVAESITKAFAIGAPIEAQIIAGIDAAIGFAEIAIIAAEKPPAFATGGFIPDGPSHANGGIKLVHSRTGQIRGEIEGGEPILSRATYRNNRSLVDALLHSSMNQGGASLQPAWKNAPVSYMNFSGIQQSLSRYHVFADGGIAPGAPVAQEVSLQNIEVQAALLTAVNNLNNQLSVGINAFVSLTDLQKQQDRLNKIKTDATGR